jgi:hypothetical protein
MKSISEALDRVSAAIENAAIRSGRKNKEITLVAASKRTSIAQIEAAIAWGLRIFGENRVQEAHTKFVDSNLINKIDALHFIGPLQTNKVKKVVGVFDLIHSVDSQHLAEKIEKEAARQSITQDILVEVNIAEEESKHGISIANAANLVEGIRKMPHLSLLGLMAIPPATENAEAARPYFSKLRSLGESLQLHKFSMGMSSDFEVAIEEGASWIRPGRAIFGGRTA